MVNNGLFLGGVGIERDPLRFPGPMFFFPTLWAEPQKIVELGELQYGEPIYLHLPSIYTIHVGKYCSPIRRIWWIFGDGVYCRFVASRS